MFNSIKKEFNHYNFYFLLTIFIIKIFKMYK